MNRSIPRGEAEARDPWLRPLQDFPGLTHLAPPVAHPETPLRQVVAALSSDPGSRVVFVIDADDRLVGWIPERTLDADLFLVLLPSEMWPAAGDVDTRSLMRSARGKSVTARQLMSPPRTVKANTSLKEAVLDMNRSKQHIVALVDDQERLLGYVTLFDVLAELLKTRP